MIRLEDDIGIEAAPAAGSPWRAPLCALAGLLAAFLVLGIAMFHS